MKPVVLLPILLSALMLTGANTASGQWGFGGDDLELVDRFDKDGDGVLNAEEREDARPTAEMNSRGGGFGRGGFGSSMSPGSPGIKLSEEDVRIYQDEDLYDPTVLRTIFIEFENPGWEKELEAFNDTDVDVPARVTVDNKVYSDVGIHFRGLSSYRFTSTGMKRSLNLSFDFMNEDQRLLGYKTLNLLNSTSDPTFLRAVYYSWVARKYIPAPKINYVRVVINGENWGIYENTQQFNKDFTRDWYDTTKGARWKVPGSPMGQGGMEYYGDDAEYYRYIYSIKSKDEEESWDDLIQMFKVLNETPSDQLVAKLSPLLDIDGVLRFLALENVFSNSDGYWTRASDYSIYQDPDGQFHVIPHDINEGIKASEGGRGGFGGFGGRGFGGGGVNLDPLVAQNDRTKPLRSVLLSVPELRETYLGYVREMAENWLDWERAEPVLQQYRNLIRDDVEIDTRKLGTTRGFDEEFDGSDSIKSFMAQRRDYLLDALP